MNGLEKFKESRRKLTAELLTYLTKPGVYIVHQGTRLVDGEKELTVALNFSDGKLLQFAVCPSGKATLYGDQCWVEHNFYDVVFDKCQMESAEIKERECNNALRILENCAF